jgi:hypothetical protein
MNFIFCREHRPFALPERAAVTVHYRVAIGRPTGRFKVVSDDPLRIDRRHAAAIGAAMFAMAIEVAVPRIF